MNKALVTSGLRQDEAPLSVQYAEACKQRPTYSALGVHLWRSSTPTAATLCKIIDVGTNRRNGIFVFSKAYR